MAIAPQLLTARDLLRDLPPGLAAHSARVAALARQLAPRFGIEPDLAARTAWLHDVARHWDDARLLAAADAAALDADPVARAIPVLLHGPIGAVLLARHGILEEGTQAWDAVCWHTSCRPGASPLEQLVFVADKLEPWKLRRAPELQPARDLAERDLPGAAQAILDWSVDRLSRERKPVQPVMEAARQWFRQQAAPGAGERGPGS